MCGQLASARTTKVATRALLLRKNHNRLYLTFDLGTKKSLTSTGIRELSLYLLFILHTITSNGYISVPDHSASMDTPSPTAATQNPPSSPFLPSPYLTRLRRQMPTLHPPAEATQVLRKRLIGGNILPQVIVLIVQPPMLFLLVRPHQCTG